MSAEAAIRWSTWAQRPADERSFRTRQRTTAVAIGQDPDGGPLWVCGDERGGVVVVDSREPAAILTLGGQSRTSRRIRRVGASTLGSRRLVAWTDGSAIETRDLDRPDARWPKIRTKRGVSTMDAMPLVVGDIDGQPIVAALLYLSDRGSATVWDAETGEQISRLSRKRERGVSPESIVLARTASGEPVAVTGESDGTVCIWDLPGGKLRQRFEAAGKFGVNAVSVGVVGGCTIVAALRHGDYRPCWLSQWHMEVQELVGPPIRVPAIDGVEALVISTLDGRPAVIGVGTVAGPFAFEIGTGEEIGIGVADRGLQFSAFALRATAQGVLMAVVTGQLVRCRRLAPGDRHRETGVLDLTVVSWDGNPAVISRDPEDQLWIRDLGSGELLDCRPVPKHRGGYLLPRTYGLGSINGHAVWLRGWSHSNSQPVDVFTGERVGPELEPVRGSLGNMVWGSAGGRLLAAGESRVPETGWRSERRLIAVWDGETGALISLRPSPWQMADLAVGVVNGEPAVAWVTGMRRMFLTMSDNASGYMPNDTATRWFLSVESAAVHQAQPLWKASQAIDTPLAVVAMLPGDRVACGGRDGRVDVFACHGSDTPGAILEHLVTIDTGSPVNALAAAPDGALVVGGGAGVQVVDLAQDRQRT